MISEFYQQSSLCQKHNIIEQYVNPDQSDKTKKYACQICIQQFYGLTSIIQINEKNQIKIRSMTDIINKYQETLNQILNSIKNYKEAINKQINNIVDLIQKQMSELVIEELENVQKDSKFSPEQFDKMEKEFNQKFVQLQHFQLNISEQLKSLITEKTLANVIENLNKLEYQELVVQESKQNINKQPIEEINQKQPHQQKYEYKLLLQSITKVNGQCTSIAINKDNSIIAAGFGYTITLFEFQNYLIKEIQSLEGHRDQIACLLFTKKSNQLISGSWDHKIKIWQQKEKNSWINVETLNGHKHYILSLIMNNNEDTIISGSFDQSIIFWKQNKNKWFVDQKIQCQIEVWSMSLNDSNTKLISNYTEQQLQIFEQQANKWILSQLIDVNMVGLKNCFVGENQFFLQSLRGKSLQYYTQDQQLKQFKLEYNVQLNDSQLDEQSFSMFFVKSKNLLIVKNGKCINTLVKSEIGQFTLDQQIGFTTFSILGCVSHDGLYLVSWNDSNNEFQVRMLNEIK